ncbi:hypothetical protein SODALDRAFT_360571 [Sodiomyces alkalinus F11]|uniref:Uncharacterized protein n=1 Tax=Sodiomyces alkalinus (strain CBS 110278 / VKM F-3762 / F11) TaxID=1314773 RepID=A0A3N2PUQ3_SODAK|nr:hypothetical protein SODALDRAFT_360571 [Sodiomyces alkalinus F11]ROT38229.1 hypothetical protein SODALDRAFT_360571 [Sodiomyces alkalinus F11]
MFVVHGRRPLTIESVESSLSSRVRSGGYEYRAIDGLNGEVMFDQGEPGTTRTSDSSCLVVKETRATRMMAWKSDVEVKKEFRSRNEESEPKNLAGGGGKRCERMEEGSGSWVKMSVDPGGFGAKVAASALVEGTDWAKNLLKCAQNSPRNSTVPYHRYPTISSSIHKHQAASNIAAAVESLLRIVTLKKANGMPAVPASPEPNAWSGKVSLLPAAAVSYVQLFNGWETTSLDA